MKNVAKWLVRVYFGLVSLAFLACCGIVVYFTWLQVLDESHSTGLQLLESAVDAMLGLGPAVVVVVATALLPLLVVAVILDHSSKGRSRKPRVAGPASKLTQETTRKTESLRAADGDAGIGGAQPNNSVNPPIRSVTVLAYARTAPSRLAGYAERWTDKEQRAWE